MKNAVVRKFGILACSLILAGAPWAGAAATDTEVPGSAAEIHPLLVGAMIPDVTLSKSDGTSVELRKVVAEKPSVLIFYRGGW